MYERIEPKNLSETQRRPCPKSPFQAPVSPFETWGADRVGVRLSPFDTYNDVGDEDPIGLYSYALSRLGELDIAYVSLIEARDAGSMEIGTPRGVDELRPFCRRPLIIAGGFTRESAEDAIRSGRADAVAFGRQFIANPDLPVRFKLGAPPLGRIRNGSVITRSSGDPAPTAGLLTLR